MSIGAKGAVTFLDVLGWKGIWQRREDAIETLLSILNNAKNYSKEYVGIGQKHKIFPEFNKLKVNVKCISDTLVLTTYGECKRVLNFHNLMCYSVLVDSLEKGMLLRGATSYGYFKTMNNILVGPAIDEVASWYEAADWIGVFQTPSANYSLNKCFNSMSIYKQYDVPLKNFGKISTRCVDWVKLWKIRNKGQEDLENIFLDMGPITPDFYSKLNNTLQYYKKCIEDEEALKYKSMDGE